MWTITESDFAPHHRHHQETMFTIGNGYLCTRGAFEESDPNDRRATFIHGVFDAAPIVVTELANAPDWLPLVIYAAGERFSLRTGQVADYQQTLDLRQGRLTRTLRWTAPSGRQLHLTFERFASLAEPHTLLLRCRVRPDFAGPLEFRATLNGDTHNDALMHWRHLDQHAEAATGAAVLLNRTRQSAIDCASAMRVVTVAGHETARHYWDVDNRPTLAITVAAQPRRIPTNTYHLAPRCA
jgi:kojibiose phosphorylase